MRLFVSGLNEPNGDHLCRSRWIPCVAAKGQLPQWGWSCDTRRIGSVAGSPDTHGTASGGGSRDTCHARIGGRVARLPPNRKWRMGHVTVTEPGVGEDHVTPVNQKWGGSCEYDEPEVAHPAPSWILSGAILARGLMSQMGTTCECQGGSPVWLGRVTCPPGHGRCDTRQTRSVAGSPDTRGTTSGAE